MATWESRITCNETYVSDGAENYSNVTLTFQIRRLDYNMVGYSNSGAAWWSIDCDGQSSGYQYFTFDWGSTAPGVWWTVGSYAFKIPHNSDGSKTISYSAYYATTISPASFSANGSSVLTKIGRYANITLFNVTNISQTSVTVNWKADAWCDIVDYSLNGDSWINSLGESFNINNLKPGTRYTLQIQLRRKDSQLYTVSNTISFTTIPIATISTSPITFNIGESINLSFANYSYNKSFLRLYQKNTDNEWELLQEQTDIQASTYNWDTSSFTSEMYENTPNANTCEIKIICGTTLNGKEYTNEYFGIANVTNSNPVIDNFTFENTDTISSDMLGNTTSMITYCGNLRVIINDKAIAQNAATILYYNISVSNGSTVNLKKINESTSQVYADFGNYQTAGSYSIRVEAVDSRGNISNLITKNFVVYKYHNPTLTATLTRVNNFEKETGITLLGYVSRVYTTSNKNALISLRYRYRESGGSWSSYSSISVASSTVDDDFRITFANDLFLTLDISKSYDFEFEIQDKIQSVSISQSVGQGIPIMCVADSFTVLMNEAPTPENLQNNNNLLVGSDIVARYNGEQYPVMESIHNKIMFSELEPENMIDDSIWAQIRATITLTSE